MLLVRGVNEVSLLIPFAVLGDEDYYSDLAVPDLYLTFSLPPLCSPSTFWEYSELTLLQVELTLLATSVGRCEQEFAKIL